MELTVEHLSKRFKDKTAVDDVCLSLTPGIWGLLGANGAGKTTLMRMIADIMKPTSGEVLYDGKNIHMMGEEYRKIFGFLPGMSVSYKILSNSKNPFLIFFMRNH